MMYKEPIPGDLCLAVQQAVAPPAATVRDSIRNGIWSLYLYRPYDKDGGQEVLSWSVAEETTGWATSFNPFCTPPDLRVGYVALLGNLNNFYGHTHYGVDAVRLLAKTIDKTAPPDSNIQSRSKASRRWVSCVLAALTLGENGKLLVFRGSATIATSLSRGIRKAIKKEAGIWLSPLLTPIRSDSSPGELESKNLYLVNKKREIAEDHWELFFLSKDGGSADGSKMRGYSVRFGKEPTSAKVQSPYGRLQPAYAASALTWPYSCIQEGRKNGRFLI
ncbi:hypothetical protein FA95DRAFT_1572502 [Auriscalpium vulgare]|uniref:Uncharacterized protein n=1 Tax=Auriscalpium vulgare TaxID=40419 RepID=A0ACB8RTG0_9AGAM|nr:hypothetical protein FA95DRAFT_1572502 [Auriscalpium vulgare]